MKHRHQNYSKNEPKAEMAERVIEETDSVQGEWQEQPVKEPRFVLKVGDDKWLKSWNPVFALCDEKSEAIVLNEDWARGHHDRVTHIKRMKAEIVEL